MSPPDPATATPGERAPSQLRAVATLSKYFIVSLLRSPGTMFFGIVFPLVFITVYGLIGDRASKVRLGVADEQTERSALVQALREHPAVELRSGDAQGLEQSLKAGKIDSIVALEPAPATEGAPPSGRVLLRYSATNPQSAAMARSFVEQAVGRLNLDAAQVTKVPYQFEAIPVQARRLRYVDFALPGQIGLSLLATAIFGTAFGLVFLKRAQVLKRFFVTPTLPITLLCGQALSRVAISSVQVSFVIAVGVFAFDFQLAQGWVTYVQMLILAMISLLAFLGFGFLIAGTARSVESVSPMANLVTLPQFLLSGTFFSTESFPAWLQVIASYLPLTYFNVAMRKVANDGASLLQVAPELLGLAVWSVVSYLIAARRFRWM